MISFIRTNSNRTFRTHRVFINCVKMRTHLWFCEWIKWVIARVFRFLRRVFNCSLFNCRFFNLLINCFDLFIIIHHIWLEVYFWDSSLIVSFTRFWIDSSYFKSVSCISMRRWCLLIFKQRLSVFDIILACFWI